MQKFIPPTIGAFLCFFIAFTMIDKNRMVEASVFFAASFILTVNMFQNIPEGK